MLAHHWVVGVEDELEGEQDTKHSFHVQQLFHLSKAGPTITSMYGVPFKN